LKGSWYPFACFVDLNVVADRLMGRGDLALAKELGRYASEANLPTLYKLFYRIGSPEYIRGKAATLWSVHHDTGRAELLSEGPGHAEFSLFDFGAPHPTLCRSLEGFLERSLELTGAKDVRVSEVRCVLRKDPSCTYRGLWRK